jgi:biopolymer transport protein ExbB/TolQ
MQIDALLKSFIYLIAGSLLMPTLLLLSIILVWIIFFTGSFCAEWYQRLKVKKAATGVDDTWECVNPSSGVMSDRMRQFVRSLTTLIDRRENLIEAEIEGLLQETAHRLWKSLDRVKMVIRLGPGLGLIGTLIPMGTGLAALGQGDITKLSSDLVIAFTTTVVGLALGLAAYCLYTVKRRWVEEDIRNMEIITEMMVLQKNGDTAP